ncbi:RNA polymerase sigma factor [Marinobacter sp. 1Y8]
MHEQLSDIYQSESRRVFATLVRLLGDFDLAEEALQDAFAAALAQWPKDGVPANPRAWLVSAGRFKAIDQIRRRMRFDSTVESIAVLSEEHHTPDLIDDETLIVDDQLRLIFTCCHPSLSKEARVALTLREVCGLATEEIARAYLVPPSTLAQRIVRAKAKIRDARIPYEVPDRDQLSERLDVVLQVIYLVFNEGYLAHQGEQLVRHELAAEAIRLTRLLLALMATPEAEGLLALMLLHDARKNARITAEGELIRLEDQDRGLWDHRQIEEGVALVLHALASREFGVYTLQAAIAALHSESPSAENTDWDQIVGLYDALFSRMPTPVIELNRAVAVAMRDGAEAGLQIVDAILNQGELAEYHLAHAARADLCRRLGRTSDARNAYQTAIAYVIQGPERRFLERQLSALPAD